jgi:ABC-type nitrate/sulfonate/bicarbonate transport system substrate-binding protein
MRVRALAFVVLVVLVGCAPPAPALPTPTAAVAAGTRAACTPAAPLNPPVKVTAVDGGIVGDVALYVGLERGYHAAEGIDLSLATPPW